MSAAALSGLRPLTAAASLLSPSLLSMPVFARYTRERAQALRVGSVMLVPRITAAAFTRNQNIPEGVLP